MGISIEQIMQMIADQRKQQGQPPWMTPPINPGSRGGAPGLPPPMSPGGGMLPGGGPPGSTPPIMPPMGGGSGAPPGAGPGIVPPPGGGGAPPGAGPGILGGGGGPPGGPIAPPTMPKKESKWKTFGKEMGFGTGFGGEGGLLNNPLFQMGMGILSENTKAFGGDPFGGAMGGLQQARAQQVAWDERHRADEEYERLKEERARRDAAGEAIEGILADPSRTAGIDPMLADALGVLAPTDPEKALELYTQAIRDKNQRLAAAGDMTPELIDYNNRRQPINDAVYTPESVAAFNAAEEARVYRNKEGLLHYDKSIGVEPGSLLVRADKKVYDRMAETTEDYEAQSLRAGTALTDASEVYKYSMDPSNGGLFGAGQTAEWKDGLYNWMGWENRDAAMRRQLSRGVTDNVMQQITKYQTGRGITDKDVEIYRAGYPTEYTNPRDLVRYELGQFKAATVAAAFANEKAQYTMAKGDEGGWTQYMEINGDVITETALRRAEERIKSAGIDIEGVGDELTAPPATFNEDTGQWTATPAKPTGSTAPPSNSSGPSRPGRMKTRGQLRREMREKRQREAAKRRQDEDDVDADDLEIVR